jgi:hypothetical protein
LAWGKAITTIRRGSVARRVLCFSTRQFSATGFLFSTVRGKSGCRNDKVPTVSANREGLIRQNRGTEVPAVATPSPFPIRGAEF